MKRAAQIAALIAALIAPTFAHAQFGDLLKSAITAIDAANKSANKPGFPNPGGEPPAAPAIRTPAEPAPPPSAQAAPPVQAAPATPPAVPATARDPWVQVVMNAYDYRSADPAIKAAFDRCVASEGGFLADEAKKILASTDKATTVSEQKRIKDEAQALQQKGPQLAKGLCVNRLVVGARRAITGYVLFDTTRALAVETDPYFVKKEFLPKANKVIADTLSLSAKQWRDGQLDDYKKLYKGQAEMMLGNQQAAAIELFAAPFTNNQIQ